MKMFSLVFIMLFSSSTFAIEYTKTFTKEAVFGYNSEGKKLSILLSEKNADFFCRSKGYDYSTHYSYRTNYIDDVPVVYDILPNGEVTSGWKNYGLPILNSVDCLLTIEK